MSSVSRELVDSTKQSKRRNKGKKKAKVKTDGFALPYNVVSHAQMRSKIIPIKLTVAFVATFT